MGHVYFGVRNILFQWAHILYAHTSIVMVAMAMAVVVAMVLLFDSADFYFITEMKQCY